MERKECLSSMLEDIEKEIKDLSEYVEDIDNEYDTRVCLKVKDYSEIFVTKERLNRKEIFERFNIDESLFDTGLIEFFNTKYYDFVKILIEPGFILY